MTVRRLTAVLALVTVAVSCGTGTEAGGPEILTLGMPAQDARNSSWEGGVSTDMPLVPDAEVTYSAAADLDLDDPALNDIADRQAWKFTVPGDVRAELNKIANVVIPAGAAGAEWVVRGQSGQKGLYRVDATDDFVFESRGDDHWRMWTYDSSPGGGKSDVVSEPCAPDRKDCTSVIVPQDDKTGGLPKSVANLPRTETATELARALLSGMGVSADSVSLSVSRDPWTVVVMARHVFRGVDSPMGWYFAFGDYAELLRAGGPVFSVVRGDTYPVIDAKDAINRLNSGPGSLWSSRAFPERSIAVDRGGGSAPQKIEVSLVSARMTLMPFWTKEGQQLMIPAWRFATDKGDSVDVAAVVDKYMVRDDSPVTIDDGPGSPGAGSSGSSGGSTGSGGSVEPVPVPTEPKVTPPTATTAAKLIGLAEAEAQKVCDSLGWKLRVTRRDGEDFAVTLELNPLRVNVAVDRGIVSEITGIG